MELFWPILLFVIGLGLIVKGGDFFVDAAAWIAEVSGIPKVIVGATIVSLATTLPEIIVSVIAAFQGESEIAVGNAVGSVTANLGLIMSICAVSIPFVIKRRDYAPKGILMVSAVGVLLTFSWLAQGAGLSITGCIILFAIFALFFYENVSSAKRNIQPIKLDKPTPKQVFWNIAKFLIGTAGIVIGAQLLVDNGSFLAEAVGIPKSIISVTFIAIGTSLPELVTTITAVIKKQGSLSVGNIIGANIIDTTLIVPICGLITGKSLPVSAQSLGLDMPFCLAIAAIAIIPMLICKKLMRWQGIAMFAAYGLYLALMIGGQALA